MRVSTILADRLLAVALSGSALAGPMGGLADADRGGQLIKIELTALQVVGNERQFRFRATIGANIRATA